MVSEGLLNYGGAMNLLDAELGKEYIIKDITVDDEDLNLNLRLI